MLARMHVDGTVAGQHLILDLAKVAKGHSAKFAIVLTDKNFSSSHGGWEQF